MSIAKRASIVLMLAGIAFISIPMAEAVDVSPVPLPAKVAKSSVDIVPKILPAQAPVEMIQPVPVAVTSTDHTALIINSVFSLLSILVTGIVAYFLKNLDKKAAVAEIGRADIKFDGIRARAETQVHRVEEVDRAEATLKAVNMIHTLVNNDMHNALATSAILARKIADLTKLPVDIEAAVVAEKAVVDHDKGQAKVDADKRVTI